MNNDHCHSSTISTNNLPISIEPDIHLSNSEQRHLDQCLSNLFHICHVPLVLNCTLLSLSSFSHSSSTTNRESLRINHYLRARQPRKFYWMRNIRHVYLNLRLPTNQTQQITANLVEFHSCKRLSYSARTMIEQIKPVLLVYYVEEHALKLNLRGDNCLLQLVFSSDRNTNGEVQKGMYYKWSDEGHIRSTTLQFDIDYRLENEHRLI